MLVTPEAPIVVPVISALADPCFPNPVQSQGRDKGSIVLTVQLKRTCVFSLIVVVFQHTSPSVYKYLLSIISLAHVTYIHLHFRDESYAFRVSHPFRLR